MNFLLEPPMKLLAVFTQLAAALAISAAVGACSSPPHRPENGPPSEVTSSQTASQVLAPTGKLRIGVYAGSPTSMVRDPVTGEARGVTVEIGRALASQLNIAFEIKEYPRLAEVVAAIKSGEVDFSITNASPARALEIDFAPTLLSLELGYLVMPDSKIVVASDVDQQGVRIGVSQGSTSQATLTKDLKMAVLVPAPTLKVAGEMLLSRTIDAFATNKAILFELAKEVPTSKVLDSRWGLEHLAMGIPKGRSAAMPYLRVFGENVRAAGIVKRAIDGAGLQGAI
jgi:polar amino acid transport system substrate-binding protein